MHSSISSSLKASTQASPQASPSSSTRSPKKSLRSRTNTPSINIDPRKVPSLVLKASGDKIPALGFGTFGSDYVSPAEMAESVRTAILAGYRHIDCASVYGNEKEIGVVLKELMDSGIVRREELWITSKVWNDHHGAGDVLLSCAQSLKDLQLDYLDLMLIHWPFPNFHPPHCSVESRSPSAKPYVHEEFMETYRQLERLLMLGLTRHIGVSNVTLPKLKNILRHCRIKPEVNQMELHPHFQQSELYRFTQEQNILNIGYCPLGSPHRPDRDRENDDTVDMEDPILCEIAARHRVHPASICLKWGIQRGHAVIPTSTKIKNILCNLAAVVSDPLTEEEMEALSQIDKNCRLIKGHVFLWPGAQDWRALWDEEEPGV